MRVFAYCVESAREAVQRATGVEPRTSPPLTADRFEPAWLEGHDLLYFRLHGLQLIADVWYNDARVAALYKGTVMQAHLGGAIVVVGNCHGAEQPAFVQTFYQAGAGAVIAGYGENVAAKKRVVGTDLLAQWLIGGLKAGLPLGYALLGAKARLAATVFRKSDRDAIGFRIVEREGE